MKRAIVTINRNGVEQVYNMVQQEDDRWIFDDTEAPLGEDTITTTVTVIDATGTPQLSFETDDEQLIYTLTNFISQNQSFYGYRMINYYPVVINSLLEYQGLTNALGFETDFLKCGFTFSFNDAFLTTMGEARIQEWERILEITPNANDTLSVRRSNVIARIISRFKLNTETIRSLVNTFIPSKVTSWFENSSVYVYITPNDLSYVEEFPQIYAELITRIPAHLGLNVGRKYTSWRAIKDNYLNWRDVMNSNDTWRMVRFKMYPSDYS